MVFQGRHNELVELNRRYNLKESQLITVYGRRRIGKSELLKQLCKNKNVLYFEGLENEYAQAQISLLVNEFAKQTNNALIKKVHLKTWAEVFDMLTDHISQKKEKIIIVLDEFQWLASHQSKLVSLLKFYWDNHWKQHNIMLILCGSMAHYMVKNVVRSKALYGRINWELHLQSLKPIDAKKMLAKRGAFETLKYLMVFGAIPKYLEEIDQTKSFEVNINNLFFKKQSFFLSEFDKIFYSQFREATTYKKIAQLLSKKNMSLTEISRALNIVSGGGLKSYLSNLENAGFIRAYTSIQQKGHKNQKYKLFDEYLNFYFKYVQPNNKIISENETQPLFQNLIIPEWSSWLGIAFEVFCLKNAYLIAEKMGFAGEVTSFAPNFGPKDSKFQIDLIFKRSTGIWVVCEIKFYEQPITSKVIPEIEKKLKLLNPPKTATIEKMLIAPFGADAALLDSQYFHHIVELEDFFK